MAPAPLAFVIVGCATSSEPPGGVDPPLDAGAPDSSPDASPACAPDSVLICYTGPQGTVGVGICKAGQKRCKADGSGYTLCEGEVLPAPEQCATAADDDCDGLVNEEGADCACSPGSVSTCYTGPPPTEGVGPCHGGMQKCNSQGTGFGPCEGEVTPGQETCATPIDDDCDGDVNEGGPGCVCTPNAIEECYSGPPGTQNVGPCKAGSRACDAQGTAWGFCIGEVLPAGETCLTPEDDDCDGQVNEGGAGCVCLPGSTKTCYSGLPGNIGVGVCKAGIQTCNAMGTAYSGCQGEVLPSPETCLTPEDDDCDGQVNEEGAACVCPPSSSASCYTGPAGTLGVGLCLGGTKACNSLGTAYGPCEGEVVPAAETCLSPADEDCDSFVNEEGAGCVCAPSSITPCYTGPGGTLGVGACAEGEMSCDSYGTSYGPCVGEVTPINEKCFTPEDDDCDGLTNEPDAGCVCTPNTVITCYTGPAGTLGVGTCSSGTATCNVQGTGYGPCMGDVVPICDKCLTSDDEDCDGAPDACSPGLDIRSVQFGDPVNDPYGNGFARDLAVDAAGNVVQAAYFSGVITIGGATLTPVGGFDMALVKLDPSGNVLWVKQYGDAGFQEPRGVAVDAAGNIVVTGVFTGSIDFGAGPLTNVGAGDVFVAKLDPSGNPIWAKQYADGVADSVALDAAGGIYFTGRTTTSVDFGAGPITAQPGWDAFFVVKLDPSGGLVYSRGVTQTDMPDHSAIAVDSSGKAVVAGGFGVTFDIGNGPVTTSGSYDVFVAQLDAGGNALWTKSFGSAGAFQVANGVALDAAGGVVLTGSFNGTLDFGGGPLTSLGNGDVFVAKLDSSGNGLWGKRFGDGWSQDGADVAVDAQGDIIAVGTFDKTIDFGAGLMSAPGLGNQLYVAKLDGAGAAIWSVQYGGVYGDDRNVRGLDLNPAGHIVIGGWFRSFIDFCNGPYSGVGGDSDIFVAELAP